MRTGLNLASGWRPVIPARVADTLIALGTAGLGLASGLGGQAQGEHVPPAALAVLTLMGLVLYPRRRFPLAVLAVTPAPSPSPDRGQGQLRGPMPGPEPG